MALALSLLNENYTTTVNRDSGSSYSEANNTEDYFRERHVPLIVNCALNTPLSLTAILGNTVVIYSIWNNPFLHSPSNMLLFGLAICDLCVGITVQPFYIIYQSFYLTNRLQTWRATMEVFNIISNLICGVSFLTTTAISIDRYLAIHLHLRYRELVTMRRAIAVLVALWIISAFVASTLIWNSNITFFAVASVIAVCLFVTFGVYVKIFTVVRHHRRRIQACQRSQTTQQFGNPRNFVKSAISMFYVCFIHLLCYLPYFIFLILRDMYKKNTFTILATEFAQTLIFLNSSLNPIVYCWRLGEIRVAVKRSLASLGCKCFENTEARSEGVITVTEFSLRRLDPKS